MCSCPFCTPDHIVIENDSAYAKFDLYPVSLGHTLIIPRRHTASWFDLTIEEQSAVISLADAAKEMLDQKYSPDGYNIGINCGIAAGQTVMHVHLHLIPRYTGDVPNPRGGVRAVIAAKQNY